LVLRVIFGDFTKSDLEKWLEKKGITIYISCNTNDNAEWQHTIRHIALEGRCFVINCDMLITKDSYPGDLATAPEKDAVSKGIVCRGGSCVIDPYGHDISETVWDMERIIYADLDMEHLHRLARNSIAFLLRRAASGRQTHDSEKNHSCRYSCLLPCISYQHIPTPDSVCPCLLPSIHQAGIIRLLIPIEKIQACPDPNSFMSTLL